MVVIPVPLVELGQLRTIPSSAPDTISGHEHANDSLLPCRLYRCLSVDDRLVIARPSRLSGYGRHYAGAAFLAIYAAMASCAGKILGDQGDRYGSAIVVMARGVGIDGGGKLAKELEAEIQTHPDMPRAIRVAVTAEAVSDETIDKLTQNIKDHGFLPEC